MKEARDGLGLDTLRRDLTDARDAVIRDLDPRPVTTAAVTTLDRPSAAPSNDGAIDTPSTTPPDTVENDTAATIQPSPPANSARPDERG